MNKRRRILLFTLGGYLFLIGLLSGWCPNGFPLGSLPRAISWLIGQALFVLGFLIICLAFG